MSMRVSDRIVAPSRGTAEMALSNISGPKQIDREYVPEVYRVAPTYGLDAAIVLSQWHVETGGGSSWRWRINGNPAGLLIEDPSNPDPATWTGTEAAHVHVWALAHACDPTTIPDWSFLPDSARYFVERWTAKYKDPNCSAVATVDDLNIRYKDATGEPQATWAWDAAYQDLIVGRSHVLYGDTLPDQGETGVPTFTTTVPGLPGGPLVTTYPIRTNMIPARNTRQRPGTKARTPRRSVQHGTGNPSNASAYAEAQYFVNGAEGRQASVHYFTDDHEAVIGVPLDEVTWQAADGAGPGNMNGFSCEMMEASVIWNNAARRDALISITADLMGRTAARLGAVKPEQHWDFNAGSPDRHDCPQLLRHTMHAGRPAWNVYAERWYTAWSDEQRRMQGGKPVYAKPDPPGLEAGKPFAHIDGNGATWLVLTPARWKALTKVKKQQYAEADAPEVGPPIDPGDTVTFIYSVVNGEGEVWFVSRGGSRCRAEAFVPVVDG